MTIMEVLGKGKAGHSRACLILRNSSWVAEVGVGMVMDWGPGPRNGSVTLKDIDSKSSESSHGIPIISTP